MGNTRCEDAPIQTEHPRAIAGPGADPNDLIDLLKSKDLLAEMNAKHMSGSVISRSTVYEVAERFIGEPLPP